MLCCNKTRAHEYLVCEMNNVIIYNIENIIRRSKYIKTLWDGQRAQIKGGRRWRVKAFVTSVAKAMHSKEEKKSAHKNVAFTKINYNIFSPYCR